MTQFSCRRAAVGTNLDMHRRLLHEVAKRVDDLDVAAYQQDSDDRRLG